MREEFAFILISGNQLSAVFIYNSPIAGAHIVGVAESWRVFTPIELVVVLPLSVTSCKS